MYDLPQQIINGVTLGSIYALIAIGYTMVYGIIGLINFAHGEVYMIGAYTGIVAIVGLPMLGITGLPIILILAFIIAMVVTSGYGYMVEAVAYKPLRNSPRLVPLISAIGMSIFLQNYVANGQSNKNIALQPIVSQRWELFSSEHMSFSISALQIIIIVVTILAMIALNIFIQNSKMGRACRACAQDLGMARLLGIDANKIIALTFVIGAALAAIAGVLVALYYGVVTPYIGFIAGLKAFTAAVLGGIGSIPGAMLGGLLLGLTESFTSAYFSTEYKDVVAFSLLILVLLFRPTGILGKPEVEKV
ncbi:high-affinity branched-chain amino acid ABC transporter permease LivH [Suttonella sp. R2A3]|uniref:high-affinity branched-chain amino acid ABC transporter permease LivH n=1 Tax=Suttonella sp. R2A3 TaxID=2908648 RepID=UPI001F38237C|nr:high-affinity branched-chain amino acid ABC transporter permease LivH [Suttonella sp. R2A3]UJF24374.1 high-affinity branched-chain amino acid ABC transporter permease LivH [Suttonella sp. R2A3]